MERIDSRQAGFLAAPALTRRKQKMEKERVQRLREARGCSDPESYVPLDWAEPVGGDVHEIPELRAVDSRPGQRGACGDVRARLRARHASTAPLSCGALGFVGVECSLE